MRLDLAIMPPANKVAPHSDPNTAPTLNEATKRGSTSWQIGCAFGEPQVRCGPAPVSHFGLLIVAG